MIGFYSVIRWVHIAAVILSGSLFMIRGGAALAGQHWPYHAASRWTSWVIDTTLLTAAAMLFSMLPGAMFANGWLTVKLVLVVVYIVLGTLAMRRTARTRTRALFYVAALCVFATIITIARAHHPYGWLLKYLA